MGILEEDNVKHPKFCVLVGQWIAALVAFAALSTVSGYHKHEPLKFAMVMISVFWVMLTIFLTMMGIGKMPVYLQPPAVEVLFSLAINVLLFVSFICIAANTLGEVNAKISAGFAFVLWMMNVLSTYVTFKQWTTSPDDNGEGMRTATVV